MDNTFNKIIHEAPQACKHLVSGDRLGQYLSALAATLVDAPEGQGQPKEANCLLLTACHAMALHVQRKSKNGVTYFAAKLYDPNSTASYKRAVDLKAEELGSLTFKDMLLDPKNISVCAGESGESVSMLAVSLDTDLQPHMDRTATAPTAENMHLALAHGVHSELQAMIPAAQNPAGIFELLQAKSFQRPFPGFLYALLYGHIETVKVFIEAVLNSEILTGPKKVVLLESSSGSLTGLFTAFIEGHAETVEAFANAVLISPLLETEKVKLLSATLTNERSGLCGALCFGQTETVKAFAKAVSNSSLLSKEGKMQLLAAKNIDGTSGLLMAYRLGHTKTVDAFVQELKRSELGSEESFIKQLDPFLGSSRIPV